VKRHLAPLAFLVTIPIILPTPALGKSERAFADHATDITPPIYNIWKQQEKTPGVSHFENSEVRWV
jgi:hypothetical protein